MKQLLRPTRDITAAFIGYMYDFRRFFRYAGCRNKNRESVRDYRAVKIYHRLEKSLSFRNRNVQSGRSAAADLFHHINKSERTGKEFTFHEKIGLKVLNDFISDPSTEEYPDSRIFSAYCQKHRDLISKSGGVSEVNAASLQSGRLQDPESFFLSRCSVRDFAEESVPNDDLVRAIKLALKTPSACNRQASFVYCIHAREKIDRILSLQNGNRGFGHEVPCLLILCADISAFDTAGERNQHWIDSGMFSMTIVWALHSLGYASCCLNWSKGPIEDKNLRRAIPIRNEHTVLMMLAVGLPKEDIKVCFSARKSADQFYKELK